jgi:hypothetical protein
MGCPLVVFIDEFDIRNAGILRTDASSKVSTLFSAWAQLSSFVFPE